MLILWLIFECFASILEEVKLFESLVFYDCDVSIIWELGCPLHKGRFVVGYWFQSNWALNTSCLVRWFCCQYFISKWSSNFTNFNQSNFPDSPISKFNSYNWINLAWRSFCKLRLLDKARHYILQLKVLENVPCMNNWHLKNTSL